MTPDTFEKWETCGIYEERYEGKISYIVVYKKAFQTEAEAIAFKATLMPPTNITSE